MRAVIFFLMLVVTTQASSDVLKVIELIEDLKSKAEGSAKDEQQKYDKSACGCEATMKEANAQIDNMLLALDTNAQNILRFKGSVGELTARITNLKNDIADNREAQEKANAQRKQENDDFNHFEAESESCIKGLKEAVDTLTEGQKYDHTSFLSQGKNNLVKILSIAEDRSMLQASDYLAVEDFAKNPAHVVALMQNNPHGDYAPQSTRINGILKSMHDNFKKELKEGTEREGKAKDSHDTFITKATHTLESLEANLNSSQTQFADDNTALEEENTDRSNNDKTLTQNRNLLEETTKRCRQAADDWAESSQLRTEEIAGFNEAIQILGEIKQDESFLQMTEIVRNFRRMGPLEKVIHHIEKVLKELRFEEEEDIKAKDECDAKKQQNALSLQQTAHNIKKLNNKISISQSRSEELDDKITATNTAIDNLNAEYQNLQNERTQNELAYKKLRKENAEEKDLLTKALAALKKFSPKGNKNYSGRTSESSNILVILEQLIDDMDKEMKNRTKTEQDQLTGFADFHKETKASIASNEATLVELKETLAAEDYNRNELKKKNNSQGEAKSDLEQVKDDMWDSANADCKWVENFEQRYNARQAEIKNYELAKRALKNATLEQDTQNAVGPFLF